MQEDASILEGVDERVVSIAKTTHFKGYRLKDGSAALGFDMKDGSYLVVRPIDGMSTAASHPGWEAARVDREGSGLRCTVLTNLHEAMVQTFKTPCPIYGEGLVADAFFDGDEVSPHDVLADVKREHAERIVSDVALR